MWVGTASADTPQQQADKLFAEGRTLLTVQKDSKAACEKFEAAIKLDSTATGTMLNLGLCYENLGKYATSIKWFRKAQAAASENKLTEYENAAKEHTVTLSPKVSTLKIVVDGPPEAEIRIDGERVDATTFGRVEVDPGSHEIVGRAPGRKKVVQSVEVNDANKDASVTVALNEPAVPVYVDRGEGRRRGALILGGAGVVALAFTGVYGYIEKKNYEDLTETDPAVYNAARDRLKYIGTTVFIVGCGAVAAGVILYLTAPGKEQVSDGTAFAPVITNDEVGFAVSGSF
jgi:tetratricopeptide (TPR) repeat protein